MSDSLKSLTKNVRMSESLVFLSKSLICSFFRKTSGSLRKTMSPSSEFFFFLDFWLFFSSHRISVTSFFSSDFRKHKYKGTV